MRRCLVRVAPLAALSSLLAVATPARAQVHWDVGAQAGVMKRFLAAQTIPDQAGFGPFLSVEGHVALLPLVRVGAYLGHDISPMPDPIAARDITWGGLHVKLMSPVPTGNLRVWLYTGFGYAGVYARSYDRVLPIGPPLAQKPTTGTVQGAGGGYFEIPLGFGASYKLRAPLALFATLGMRFGFAFSGSAYEEPGAQWKSAGQPDQNIDPPGRDQYALGLGVGALLDL
jgi:hypothetical protein